ncbi:MAG UNVERIFIED_CONTAM: hypothetical protein LVR18_46200 [Planctomycetaceae bacterium]
MKRSAELFSDCSAEWVAFFCTDPNVSPEMIIESVADRSAIEQNFHDVKEVHGAGEQQVRNVWCNVACWNLCLWPHKMVELWSWRRSGTTLKQRDDRPRDDPTRRPCHADRLKTLKNKRFARHFPHCLAANVLLEKSSVCFRRWPDWSTELRNCQKVQFECNLMSIEGPVSVVCLNRLTILVNDL